MNALPGSLFAECFTASVETLREAEPDIVATDGKTSRRARRGAAHPLHLVSAWATRQRLVLGQEAVDRKGNEITVIHHRVATVEAMQLVLASRTTSIEAASRTEVSALRAELQARNERTLEGQRGLSEQIIEQRGDVKAIRASLERLERQIENATGATRDSRRTR